MPHNRQAEKPISWVDVRLRRRRGLRRPTQPRRRDSSGVDAGPLAGCRTSQTAKQLAETASGSSANSLRFRRIL